MKTKLLLAVMTVISAPIAANDDAYEIRVGAGVNFTGGLHPGAWLQPEVSESNKNKDYGSAFSLELIGRTPISWLDYQIGLAYRKGSQAYDSVYVTDPCYGDMQFSGGPVVSYNGMPAKADCDRRFYLNKVETETKAVTLGLVPTIRGHNWSFGVMLGISIHDTEVKIDWDQSRGEFKDVERDVDSVWVEHGTTYYIAPSLRYSNYFVTFYYAYGETAPESMGNGNRGFVAGLAF